MAMHPLIICSISMILHTLLSVLISPYCSLSFTYGIDKENLFDNQELPKSVIISSILMIFSLDSKGIL